MLVVCRNKSGCFPLRSSSELRARQEEALCAADKGALLPGGTGSIRGGDRFPKRSPIDHWIGLSDRSQSRRTESEFEAVDKDRALLRATG